MERTFSANPEDKVTLLIGGLRITIEPSSVEAAPAAPPPYASAPFPPPPAHPEKAGARPLSAFAGSTTPARHSSVIEMTARGPGVLAQSRPDLLVPAPGKLFLREGDQGAIIKEVISQDEGSWLVIDTTGLPALISVQGAALCAQPIPSSPPQVGDSVFSQEGSFEVQTIIGEVEGVDGGGWVIADPSGTYIWVFQSSPGRWVKLANAPM